MYTTSKHNNYGQVKFVLKIPYFPGYDLGLPTSDWNCSLDVHSEGSKLFARVSKAPVLYSMQALQASL